jgi:uncharacterized protein YcfL
MKKFLFGGVAALVLVACQPKTESGVKADSTAVDTVRVDTVVVDSVVDTSAVDSAKTDSAK